MTPSMGLDCGTLGLWNAAMTPKLYKEFWPLYLDRHRSPVCRFFHHLGLSVAILSLLISLSMASMVLFFFSLLSFYLIPWIGSFFFEKRKPLDFRYPYWSFLSHFHLYYLWLLGSLEKELLKYHS